MLSSSTEELLLVNCSSGDPEDGVPILDYNGSKGEMGIKKYSGSLIIRNYSDPYPESVLDIDSGAIVLESTCTDGSLTIRGIATFVDNSNGTTVDVSGLIFADETQLTAFGNKVYQDVVNGVSGTQFPIGTRASPVNNFGDAATIANARGIGTIFVFGSMTIGSARVVDGLTIEGESFLSSVITVVSGASTIGTKFLHCSLVGTLNGAVEITNCDIGDSANLTNVGSTVSGSLFQNCIVHNMDFLSSGTEEVLFMDCKSGEPGSVRPVINYNNSETPLGIRNYVGGIKFTNMTSIYGDHSVDFISGTIELDTTCTEGSMIVRGSALVEDNSGPNFSLNTDAIAEEWDKLISNHQLPNSFGKKLVDILKLKRTMP